MNGLELLPSGEVVSIEAQSSPANPKTEKRFNKLGRAFSQRPREKTQTQSSIAVFVPNFYRNKSVIHLDINQ